MKLPDDFCRCLDDECPQKEKCRRWLERKVGGEWVTTADTLRIRKSKLCKLIIKVKRG